MEHTLSQPMRLRILQRSVTAAAPRWARPCCFDGDSAQQQERGHQQVNVETSVD